MTREELIALANETAGRGSQEPYYVNALARAFLEACKDQEASIEAEAKTFARLCKTMGEMDSFRARAEALAKENADLNFVHSTNITRITRLEGELAAAGVEAEKWKDEYSNVCKFANGFEEEADRLRGILNSEETRAAITAYRLRNRQ